MHFELQFICCLYYWLITAIALIASLLPSAQHLISYGRLNDGTGNTPPTRRSYSLIDPRRLWRQTVPKQWFWHFYLLGTVWNTFLLTAINVCPNILPWTANYTALVRLSMMQVHLVRRLLECLFVQRPSDTARMLLGHYALGLSFYLITCLSMSLDNSGQMCDMLLLVKLLIFAWANWQQFKCHRLLANLRPANKQQHIQVYSLPVGEWFDSLLAPHYTFELIIYSTLLIIGKSITMISSPVLWCTVWCLVNLSITAGRTRQWYERRFMGDKYALSQLRRRWTLLPFVY
jgi:3-oxo-5-alpha-steroid 4-dehydrogenase 3